jgi:DNA-binding MarR family transcriptional regulator
MLARVQRRYTYLVWPYGAQMAHAACETLSQAMADAKTARKLGMAAVWIVRSDGQEVQLGCTRCHKEEEAFRVISERTRRAYWCTACCQTRGTQRHTSRLSRLQQDILRWLGADTLHAPAGTTSSHTALAKALGVDKGNLSKSLRNLAGKHFLDIHYSPGGKAIALELTPTGRYKADHPAKL